MKPKYREKARSWFMETQLYGQFKNIYVHIGKDDERRFGSSNYELDKPLQREKS